MKTINEQAILFDDFSILMSLIGKNALPHSSAANDCDCVSYSSTADQDDVDTDQITPSVDKTN